MSSAEAINVNNNTTFDSEIEFELDQNLAQQLITAISTPIEPSELLKHMKTTPSPSLVLNNNDENGELIDSISSSQINDNSISNSFVTKIKNFSFSTPNHSLSFLHAVFDNIVGPKCLHFWSTHTQDFNNYLLKYMAVHTLNGELYNQDKLFNSFKYRFYSIKEVNFSLLTIFFDANTIFTQNHQHHLTSVRKDSLYSSSNSSLNQASQQLTVLNCFSIIVPLELQQYLLDKSDFILSSFENCILEFRVFAEVMDKANNVTLAIQHLSKFIDEICTSFSVLENRGIKNINLKETYFHGNLDLIDKDFLSSALASHLITNMNSLVIGSSSASINKMIATLGYIMPKEKLKLSCYSLHDQSSISPFFHLQGFVTEITENLNLILNTDFLFTKNSSSTIIDLCANKIYRTPLIYDFTYCKEIFIERKIKFYYNLLKKEDLLDEWPVNTLLKLSNQSKSFLIDDLFKQIDSIELQFGLRDAFIDLFIKNLNISALTLIEFVNNEISKHNQQNAKTSQSKATVCVITSKKLIKELGYRNEEDLLLIASFASHLKMDFLLSFHLKL